VTARAPRVQSTAFDCRSQDHDRNSAIFEAVRFCLGEDVNRKLVLAVAATLLIAEVSAAGGWKKSIAEAQREAKPKNQLILVDMYADWCGWCKKMAREVFPSEAFQKGTEDLVLLQVDTEDGEEGSNLAVQFGVTTLPTFVLMTHDMMIAGVIRGYAPAEKFVKDIDAAVADYRNFGQRVANESSRSGDLPWRLELAKEFIRRRGFDQAIQRLESIVTTPGLPDDSRNDAIYHLAVAHAGKEDYSGSIRTLDRLDEMVRNGEFAERSSILRAQVYYQKRDYQNAVTVLRRFKDAFPESALMPNVNRLLPQFEAAARAQ